MTQKPVYAETVPAFDRARSTTAVAVEGLRGPMESAPLQDNDRTERQTLVSISTWTPRLNAAEHLGASLF